MQAPAGSAQAKVHSGQDRRDGNDQREEQPDLPSASPSWYGSTAVAWSTLTHTAELPSATPVVRRGAGRESAIPFASHLY